MKNHKKKIAYLLFVMLVFMIMLIGMVFGMAGGASGSVPVWLKVLVIIMCSVVIGSFLASAVMDVDKKTDTESPTQ